MPARISEYSQQYPALEKLANDLLLLSEFTNALSNGDLSQTLHMRGYFPGSLKALQSNLRHLTWQTHMVASGDYSQRVDFMGDFSHSFNTMIIRLREATENEQRYIAELEKSQAAIAESERKYRLIAENTDDVIWLLDNEMSIQYISPSIEKLLGYIPKDFEGKPAGKTPLPFLQAVFQQAKALFTEKNGDHKPFIIENEQTCKNKKVIWTESSISIVKNGEGKYCGILGVTRDISERKKNENLLYQTYERRKKSDFFNQLAASKNDIDAKIYDLAWQSKVYIAKDFSLFFLLIDNLDTLISNENNLHRKQQIIDTLVDHLSRKENTIAWETLRGIGIITSAWQNADRKTAEWEAAQQYIKDLSLYFPNLKVRIGIANYADGLALFSSRLCNAETASAIGKRVWPEKLVYHYEDCGNYRALAPFARTTEADVYVTKMIGPLIEHDKTDGTDLVETLKRILSGLSFKEIGTQMYLHHKTIQLRKQRIEQILNLSLDSYETRLALATAIQLKEISHLDG
jgi:PAS domain S-box-containing protein